MFYIMLLVLMHLHPLTIVPAITYNTARLLLIPEVEKLEVYVPAAKSDFITAKR
jgi:hypothetical protein